MKDFLAFRRMLTPYLIQLFFWIALLLCVITAVADFRSGEVWLGIAVLIIGPLFTRLSCEVLIIFFKINEAVTEINHTLKQESGD